MRPFEQNGDHEIILKAKDGDMDAFEILVKKYQQPIYSLCQRMTGEHQSADDLSQETFIKAFISLQKFKDGMSFFSWIRKIAFNNSLNYLKRILLSPQMRTSGTHFLDESGAKFPTITSIFKKRRPTCSKIL